MPSAENSVIEVSGGADLATILLHAVEIGASDVHLTVGEPACFRHHGVIVPSNLPVLDRDSLHSMLYDMLDDEKRKTLERDKELDFALQLGDAARFRANCFYTMRGEGAVFRVIPTKIKSFQDLGLPSVLMKVASRPRGLVLVTGPTGSGKSTTLAAMIDYVNSTRDDHIITIEDPIEFVHRNKRCIVNQRELGSNTKSFASALRSALREDPDIILVGELRDLETISLALTASETGHLVFGTLHTQSAAKTCDRVVDVFPPEQQKLVRLMFAETFEAIVCQNLVPRQDGRGRVLAMEIMVGVPSTRSLIREGKSHQLASIIQTAQKLGMQTLDHCLKDLMARNIISEFDALTRANNPDAIVRDGVARLEEYLAREARATTQANQRAFAASNAAQPAQPIPAAAPPRPPTAAPPQPPAAQAPRPVGLPPMPPPNAPPALAPPPPRPAGAVPTISPPPAAPPPPSAPGSFPFGPKKN